MSFNKSFRSDGSLNSILQLISGYRSAKILFTAVSLNLFSLTYLKWRKASEISRCLRLSPRACRIFVDALSSLGFLRKKGNSYTNSSRSNCFLTPKSPKSVYHNLRYQNLVWDGWSDLENILKIGRPRVGLRARLCNRRFTQDYIEGMKEIARVTAPEVAKHLVSPKFKNMLDVGGGSGNYLFEILRKNPAMRGTILDLPQTLSLTRTILNKDLSRIDFIPGDYHSTPFGKEKYDLVLISHVTHDESLEDNKQLIKKAFVSLRPGGIIAIHDFMLNKNGLKPVFSALFSVHMLTYTVKGQTYSEWNYREWLTSAGFCKVGRREICEGAVHQTTLLVAKKDVHKK